MNKIKEFFEDVIWFFQYKPKDIYSIIRHWIKTCGKYKTHWRFASYSMFHCYPWDYCYFLELQYEWIKKSQEYFNDYCYCSEEKKDEINRYQRIALGCLEIILDKKDYWDYDTKNHKIVMKVPVNLKNKHRFPYMGIDMNGNKKMSTDIYENCPDEYYKQKAKYLYFKILRDYSENWWD